MGIAKIDNKGFTIIEVSMVLAIAGLLFFGIMLGITRQVQQQRFKESVDATQSFLQQQYNEAVNIINDRNINSECGVDVNRGASGCPIIGRLITFYKQQSDEYVMEGKDIIINDNSEIDTPGYSATLLDYLNDSDTNARVIDSGNNTSYFVPWGAKMTQPKDNDGSGDAVSYIALVRSPRGGELNIFKLDENTIGSPLKFEAITKKVTSCIESQELVGFKAAISIDGGVNSQDGVTTKFDEATCS